jgi:DNA polymerase-3 subunit beta
MRRDPIDIYFNARYLLDALRTINSDEVLINFTSVLGPAVIKPVSGDDKYLSLLLPARANRQ